MREEKEERERDGGKVGEIEKKEGFKKEEKERYKRKEMEIKR